MTIQRRQLKELGGSVITTDKMTKRQISELESLREKLAQYKLPTSKEGGEAIVATTSWPNQLVRHNFPREKIAYFTFGDRVAQFEQWYDIIVYRRLDYPHIEPSFGLLGQHNRMPRPCISFTVPQLVAFIGERGTEPIKTFRQIEELITGMKVAILSHEYGFTS